MTLRINLGSSHSALVPRDIALIVGDDAQKVSIQAGGEVLFHSAPVDFPGATIVANLFDDPGIRVTIHAADGKTMSVVGTPGQVNAPGTPLQPLCATGIYWSTPGPSTGSSHPSTVDIDVVYDAGEVGGPYIGYDPSGTEIPMPPAVLLFFGLCAAAHWYGSSYFQGTPPNLVVVKLDDCLKVENSFRLDNFMPERKGPLDVYGKVCPVKPHKRTSPPPPPKSTGKVYTLPRCFIASAAYGTPLADEVDFLRRFRDDVLTRTRGGYDFFSRFHDQYYRFSPAITAGMNADPELAALMRQGIVEPLVHWLEVATRMPDAELDGVPEPWAAFISELQDTLENWSTPIAMPRAIDSVDGIEGARELGNILRFILRKPQSREAFLADLELRGVIPLELEPHQRSPARAAFAQFGRPEREVDRVFGSGGQSQAGRQSEAVPTGGDSR